MALQFLYSAWLEQDGEHAIKLYSEGVTEEDIDYIMHTANLTDRFEVTPDDEENEDLSNTLYLRLPSSAYAIIRTGCYENSLDRQSGNIILHAYIAEEGEEISPMLYAINNCFRVELTPKDQEYLLSLSTLPTTPLPRPQFKLSQAEIKKFFSQGRLRTLSCILQSVIDSYGNPRMIIINDSYPSLKYWFYGIECCLPKSRKTDLTYSTYAFKDPETCELICTAPNHSIDLDEMIDAGNFVIDNIGERGCGDIEAAGFAASIVHDFWEDAAVACEMCEGIEALIEKYNLNVANSAGLYKLVNFEFEWFSNAYDIHYFLGKVRAIDPVVLSGICHKLWGAFMKPDFKFKLNADNLPLLAYIFRNTDDTVRWDIIQYIDTHKEDFGYHQFNSFNSMYLDLTDRLSFITEYLPITLIRSNSLRQYVENRNTVSSETATFLCIIVDNYNEYIQLFNEDDETLHDNAIYLFERLLQSDRLDLAETVCRRSIDLPFDFLRYVLIQGVLNSTNKNIEEELRIQDEFVYQIARLFIKKDRSLALELVKNHAREGRYHDSTLALYNEFITDYPEETADFNDVLKERAVYNDFVTDSVFYKFASRQNITEHELAEFFFQYYIAGEDKNHNFETKLMQYLHEQLPVCSIATAHRFLCLLNKHIDDFHKYTLSGMLCSYILHQKAADLWDYYGNDLNAFQEARILVQRLSSTLSPSFIAASSLILIVASTEDLKIRSTVFNGLVSPHSVFSDPLVSGDFVSIYCDKLIKVSHHYRKDPDSLYRLVRTFIFPLLSDAFSKASFIAAMNEQRGRDPVVLYPLTAYLAVFSQKTQDPLFEKQVLAVLDTIPRSKRREVYLTLTECLSLKDEQEALKFYLTPIYYRELPFLKRIFSIRSKKLFKK